MLKLTYEGAIAKAELVWQSHVLCNDVFSSVLADGFVYGSDVRLGEAKADGGTPSQFKCVELATGRECWSSKRPGYANVLSCGDKLILVNEAGELLVVAASAEAYRELARVPVIGSRKPCWTAPTVCRGRLLLRNHQSLVCCQIGTDPEGAVTVGMALGTKSARPATIPPKRSAGWVDAPLAWLDRHQNSDLSVPSLGELGLWYCYCLGLFALAGASAWVLRRRFGNMKTFVVASLILALFGLPTLSALTGSVVFTWPVGCHAIFAALLAAETRTLAPPRSRWKSLAPLFFFVLFCLGYCSFCRQLYILIGVGFLVGFLPALPAARLFVRFWLERAGAVRIIGAGLLSFSLYFWGSALQILWRTMR